MKRPLGFSTKTNNKEYWYDLKEDWHLIESSLAKQYGIRIRQHTDMPWDEFSSLISGLMNDTPLGKIVEIRSENDPEIIKKFNSSQKSIYNEWRSRRAKEMELDKKVVDEAMANLEKKLQELFG